MKKKRIVDPKIMRARKKAKKFRKAPILEVFLNHWLKTYIIPYRKPSTIINYRSYIRHITDVIGDYSIKRITPDIVDYLIEYLLTQGKKDGQGGLATKTVKEIRNMLHQAMAKAVEEGYITSNPVTPIQVKLQKQEEPKPLDKEDQAKIEAAISPQWSLNSDYFIILALKSGMRKGEIAGLTVQDIDLEKRIIHVNKSLNRYAKPDENGKGKWKLVVGTTKNGQSRDIPMSNSLYEGLKIYFETMPAIYKKPNMPLFLNSRGKVMEPRLIQYHFQKLMTKLNIQNVHFHLLRHTFATNAMEADMNVKACSKILGHSSIHMTADVYTHVSDEQLKKEIGKMEPSTTPSSYSCLL